MCLPEELQIMIHGLGTCNVLQSASPFPVNPGLCARQEMWICNESCTVKNKIKSATEQSVISLAKKKKKITFTFLFILAPFKWWNSFCQQAAIAVPRPDQLCFTSRTVRLCSAEGVEINKNCCQSRSRPSTRPFWAKLNIYHQQVGRKSRPQRQKLQKLLCKGRCTQTKRQNNDWNHPVHWQLTEETFRL